MRFHCSSETTNPHSKKPISYAVAMIQENLQAGRGPFMLALPARCCSTDFEKGPSYVETKVLR
jgi:hypothetical protein